MLPSLEEITINSPPPLPDNLHFLPKENAGPTTLNTRLMNFGDLGARLFIPWHDEPNLTTARPYCGAVWKESLIEMSKPGC